MNELDQRRATIQALATQLKALYESVNYYTAADNAESYSSAVAECVRTDIGFAADIAKSLVMEAERQ